MGRVLQIPASKAEKTAIDEDKGIYSIMYDADEEYFDVASIRRINYLETKSARGLDAKNRALLADVQESTALMPVSSAELAKIVRQVEKLFSINHDSGRTREIVSNRIYALLVRAKQIIMADDFKRRLISMKKIPTQVIGQEYVAPFTGGFDLEEEYLNKIEKDKTEAENNAKL